MGSRRSNDDRVHQLSSSIFVTNFPENFSARDLWKACQGYGTVIDTFIPNRLSKAGKRFGFARFIKVDDVDCLVQNLCTIWVGRFKLNANVARFQRLPLKNVNNRFHQNAEKKQPTVIGRSNNGSSGQFNSYANVVKQGLKQQVEEGDNRPALVLDESCIRHQDMNLSLIGKVKEFGSLPNLKIVLDKEGFDKIVLKYLGGLWVLIEFQSRATLENFKTHTGVGSWFSTMQQAINSFQIEGRVAWVDIEGVPLNAWTKKSFSKICSKWGEMIFEEEVENSCLYSKRVCIQTSMNENIFESFKIIVRGKVYWVRAKEVSGWVPDFLGEDEEENNSDNGREEDAENEMYDDQHKTILEEGDVAEEKIPETILDQDHLGFKDKEHNKDDVAENPSDDPFKIYELLRKEDGDGNGIEKSGSTANYPPGFTPREESDGNPPGFTPREESEVNSNSVDKARKELRENSQKYHEEDTGHENFKSHSKEDSYTSGRSGHSGHLKK